MTHGYRRVRDKTTKQLFFKFNLRKIVTGDETLVQHLKPIKMETKLQTIYGKRPVILQRTGSIKKVFYCILVFSCNDMAIQIPLPKSKNDKGQCYLYVMFINMKKYYPKRRSVPGFFHVRFLYGNPPHVFLFIVMLHHILMLLWSKFWNKRGGLWSSHISPTPQI